MKEHDKIFHLAAETHKSPSNLDMTNSGSDNKVDAPTLRDFSGLQKKGKRTFMSTPIQPVWKRDPRYKNEERPPKGKGYSNRLFV